MKILVLGGTAFVGRHLTEVALDRGHEVVHFNRGRTSPGLFTEVETVVGDRESGLGALAGRSFDVVVDTSGYEPATVATSARQLSTAAGHYTFISSVSVYADVSSAGVDETLRSRSFLPMRSKAPPARRTTVAEGPVREGGRAGLSRYIARHPARPDRRPSRSHRAVQLLAAPACARRRGPCAAPGRATRPAHRRARPCGVDRRLCRGSADGCLQRCRPGVAFVVRVPAGCLPYCFRSDATVSWIDEQFLLDEGVEPWSELPLWIPSSLTDYAGFDEIDGRRALRAGLLLRPLYETVAATLAETEWARGSSLAPEREVELLSVWHRRKA